MANDMFMDDGFFAFEKLDVYRQATDSVVTAYRLTRTFSEKERFGLTSQIRRAATSVTLNIAEGRGRGSERDFARFLHQARGSLLEVVTGFHLAERLDFITRQDTRAIYAQAHHLSGKLVTLIRASTSLSPSSGSVLVQKGTQ